MTHDIAKRAAAEKALEFVEEGMILGLGTGTTAAYFIEALSIKSKKSSPIRAVASSRKSAELAKQLGFHLFDINDVSHIDLYVDGADEIDLNQNSMIKGGGGAHLREKILCSASKQRVIIVDESKLSSPLHKAKLPVEILLYGSMWAKSVVDALHLNSRWRYDTDGNFFITDSGNLLLDIFPPFHKDLLKLHEQLTAIPAVVETGFFFHLASTALIGKNDGTVEIRTMPV